MSVFEFLTVYENVMRKAHRNGIGVEHTRYLQIYRDWLELEAQHDKKQYCEAVIAEKYDYTTRQIRNIVRFMQETVK